jgi:hypothetical protein
MFHTFAHIPNVGSSYFTEAYRSLVRFCTGSHNLVAVIGHWGVERDSFSFRMRQQCSFYCLDRIKDEDHFLFESPVYRHLRSESLIYVSRVVFRLLFVYLTLCISRTSEPAESC